jgi:hypothetical protein
MCKDSILSDYLEAGGLIPDGALKQSKFNAEFDGECWVGDGFKIREGEHWVLEFDDGENFTAESEGALWSKVHDHLLSEIAILNEDLGKFGIHLDLE